MTRFAFGLAPRRRTTEARWLASRRYVPSAAARLGALPAETVLQPLATLHDQRSKGSCVGQAHGQGIESITGRRVSCVDLWEGGRILQGDAGDYTVGTRSEYVVAWLERHGWGDYQRGEDARGSLADTDRKTAASLADAMRAAQRRHAIASHRVIDTTLHRDDVAALVVAALGEPGCYVVFGGGVRDPFFTIPPDTIATTDARGGWTQGHAERVAGWSAERGAFLVQGSWGDWTRCAIGGALAKGCYYAAPEVLAAAWEIDVVRVVP